MKHLATINPENTTETDVANFNIREAARAIVIDNDNNVALLYVRNESYYKLPGGGIEQGESRKIALQRECMEEIGNEVTILEEVGEITECRKIFNLKQISYCYLSKLKGEKGSPSFTEEELAKGFTVKWLPYKEAFKTITECNPSTIEGKQYIVPRDTLFLKEAAKHFSILK